jgi:hypothetical protein
MIVRAGWRWQVRAATSARRVPASGVAAYATSVRVRARERAMRSASELSAAARQSSASSRSIALTSTRRGAAISGMSLAADIAG